MKKVFFLSLVLTVAMGAQAQLKVAPKMQLGDQKTYESKTVMNLPGQSTVTLNDETTISVAEVLADGFVLSVETTKVTSDAKADDIAGQLIAAAQEMMMGADIRVATNAEGKPLDIVNFEDLKKNIDKRVDLLIEKMMKTTPQLGEMMPKETLKTQIMANLTKESLLMTFSNSSCPLILNGKTLMTGAQEEYTTDQGIKMKRMFFVNGNKVTTNGSANMSKEELKEMIIKQVEKAAPEQADMVKQNIDQLMASGMLKIDVKETASYEIQEDGWVKSISGEVNNDAMGQQIKTTYTVTLK